jgi:hypothetical protein
MPDHSEMDSPKCKGCRFFFGNDDEHVYECPVAEAARGIPNGHTRAVIAGGIMADQIHEWARCGACGAEHTGMRDVPGFTPYCEKPECLAVMKRRTAESREISSRELRETAALIRSGAAPIDDYAARRLDIAADTIERLTAERDEWQRKFGELRESLKNASQVVSATEAKLAEFDAFRKGVEADWRQYECQCDGHDACLSCKLLKRLDTLKAIER